MNQEVKTTNTGMASKLVLGKHVVGNLERAGSRFGIEAFLPTSLPNCDETYLCTEKCTGSIDRFDPLCTSYGGIV